MQWQGSRRRQARTAPRAAALLYELLVRVVQTFREDPRDLEPGSELNVERGLEALDILRDRVQVLESALRDAEKDPSLATSADVRNQAAQVIDWAETTIVPLDLAAGDELGDLLEADQGCEVMRRMVAALDDPPSLCDPPTSTTASRSRTDGGC